MLYNWFIAPIPVPTWYSGSGLDENNGFLQKDIEKVQKMRGDLSTINKLSSSSDKSDLFQAQSLRKQYYPINADDINPDTTNLFWWKVIGFTSGIILTGVAFWYFGYFDNFSGKPDAGSDIIEGPRGIPLPASPSGQQDIDVKPSSSTSGRILSDIGSKSSSDTSGSLTPTNSWSLSSSMRKSFDDYWAPEVTSSAADLEKSPFKLKKLLLDTDELNSMDKSVSANWAATPEATNSSIDPKLLSGAADSHPFDPSTSTVIDNKTFSRVATNQVLPESSRSVMDKGKFKVGDTSIFPDSFPSRFSPKAK